MIEIAAALLKAAGEVVADWIGAAEKQKIELEQRAMGALQVLRGERILAHEEIDSRLAETKRVVSEAVAAEAAKPQP